MSVFSIIIPVYNGADFINKCYHSLSVQSFQDWEAIFVNDGSKDESIDILEKLHNKDERVVVVNQENAGEIQARYAGIKAASGRYCTFLDVDDEYADNALYILADTINKYNNPDMVMFNCKKKYTNGNKLYDMWQNLCDQPTIFTGEKYKKLRELVFDSKRLNNIWLKAIKTSIVHECENLQNTSHVRTEGDLLMQLPYFDKAINLLYIPEYLYIYVTNESSVTHTYDPYLFESVCYMYNELMKYGENWNVEHFEERCGRRFLRSTIATIVKDSHNLQYSNFKKKVTDIKNNSIYKYCYQNDLNSISKSRQLFLKMLDNCNYYTCYLMGKMKKVIN
jgi:glycosyltransferase involved in cell wall biosynthesis